MKKILILMLALVLIAGCTQPNRGVDLSSLEDLSSLPSINSSGMPELNSLPSTNNSITLNTGLPSANPFPSEPELE